MATTSVSGLVSGIQWSDMIDQIMQVETSRTLTPITDKQSKDQLRLAAWKSYSDVVAKLRDASATLRNATAFGAFSATVGKSPSTGSSVVSATATAGAIPATYKVEVQDLARAEKLGANSVSDVNSALGYSGDVLVGGKKLSVNSTDSLSALRDKINALNTGTNPSRVSASILTVSTGVNRLVLTSDVTGSSGIELVENGGSNVLSSLGLVSSTLEANTVDGSARSYGFTTSTTPLGQALATTMPAPGSFKVNGARVDVDLSQDSLKSVVDKINAAAGPDIARVVTETVNGQTVSRVLVNGTVTPYTDDGAAAETVSTQNLQQLGFLRNSRGPGMQLFAPSDARVVIDGIAVRRSTNTISDALAGVSLTLQQAEVGTTVDVSVGRDDSKAVQALKDYASAYNAVSSYVATNTAEKAPLAFDTTIRSTLRQFTQALLNPVVGLDNTVYMNAPMVGVALDKSGKLQVDETKLKAALTANPDEVRKLFSTTGRSTLSTVEYAAASSATKPGTYAVSITQAATMPSATGSVIAGTYGNAATANTMKVFDSFTGKTTTIALADNDTAASIAGKLNVAFGNDGVRAGASVAGGALQLTGTQYGSNSKLTVSFELDSVAAAQQLGFAAAPYAGLDVAGTINGKAATGSGRLLTAQAPTDGSENPAQGLSVLYTDTAATASADVSYVLGIGGMVFGAADPMMQAGDGQIQTQQDSIQTAIDNATKRADAIQARLDKQRETLTRRFTAMETAMSRLQAQSNALTSQLNSLQQASK